MTGKPNILLIEADQMAGASLRRLRDAGRQRFSVEPKLPADIGHGPVGCLSVW